MKGKEICYSLPTNLVKVLILQLVGMQIVSYFFRMTSFVKVELFQFSNDEVPSAVQNRKLE